MLSFMNFTNLDELRQKLYLRENKLMVIHCGFKAVEKCSKAN